MFDHVTIRASDREASELFYDTVLPALGLARTASGDDFTEWSDFSVADASPERPVTRGLHVGFRAPTRELVDEFWRTGLDDGYRDDGEPGPRPEYGPDYYGSFLLDPDDNSAEGVWHGGLRKSGTIDHLWIRVIDVAASKAFYETVGRYAGFGLRTDTPSRAGFTSGDGSFSLVAGIPTENAHLAFAVSDDAAVDAFHNALVSAGYRDNGGPGERPSYHEGYYAAFVLDPDGNNVEIVNHNR